MFSLDAHIICNNPGVITAVKMLLPNSNDPRIDGYFEHYEYDDDNGDNVLKVIIRFKPANKADRDSIFVNMEALDHIFDAQCEAGSFIGYHTCGNYENPAVSCKDLELYRKKWNGSTVTVEHTIGGVSQ